MIPLRSVGLEEADMRLKPNPEVSLRVSALASRGWCCSRCGFVSAFDGPQDLTCAFTDCAVRWSAMLSSGRRRS